MKRFLLLIPLIFILTPKDAQACETIVAGFNENILAEADIIRDADIQIKYQVHTYAMCQQYGFDYELALAVMSGESDGDIKAFNINRNGSIDKGLMQINSCNYEWLREELGATDFYNPYQNIQCGVYMLSLLSGKYNDNHQILMSYNMGECRMKQLWKQGIRSSAYSRKVMQKYNQLWRDKH